MAKLTHVQMATSMESDFSESTWLFLMKNKFKFQVSAGDFALVPKNTFELILNTLVEIKNWDIKRKLSEGEMLPHNMRVEIQKAIDECTAEAV